MIGFGVFALVAALVTATIWNTLARTVSGGVNTYSATFSDVLGLRDGDDVRIAGVRVGKVTGIGLDSHHRAVVRFVVQRGQTIFGDTKALVRYQNLIGQRYIALQPGTKGNPAPLGDGGSLPIEQTEPSFDISGLLNGFEPLFQTLNTQQVNDLSNTLVQALQGDGVSLSTFIVQATGLAGDWRRRDTILSDVITQLSGVMQSLAARGAEFETLIAQTRALVGGLYQQGQVLTVSAAGIATATSSLTDMFTRAEPKVVAAQNATTGALNMLLGVGPELDRAAVDLPNIFTDVGHFTSSGAYGDGYVCSLDVSLYGVLLPRGLLSQVGGNSHSAVCR
ncbi:MlaD family protein [Nocardia coffeae]|uniref:MlaD family protein n=1 Tax=Nocardia coffeae TaxID=2873381 RepID=UPI001F1E3890